jgi:hypothetical protein
LFVWLLVADMFGEKNTTDRWLISQANRVLEHNVSLFAWLISHRPAVLFSQNKPATSQQYFSLRTNQHQLSATSQTNRPVDD